MKLQNNEVAEELKKVLPPETWNRELAYRFFKDWLREVQKELKRKSPRRGHPLTLTNRKWLKNGSTSDEVFQLRCSASKVMERLNELVPEVGKAL